MTNISLRVYNREIEAMVENGRLEDAIAHCRHILKTYPMHLDTYRLLGKAFLEARRYSDASDIFQRVILSVPDDFVSHVGMSIIRDDEGKLDQATWHMERAFEVQPSNPAIQDELRKLYGRRDGVEPAKVRLTRDALANMYTQGALYSQAIAEIRAVLTYDPNRPDLQVMLARAYSRDDRKSQAIELCSGLLRKYPYCFDALRILLDLMTTTDRLDILQSYRQRVYALDPYAAFVTGSVFDSNKVADNAITLDQLEILPNQDEIEIQPSWSSSLGIKLESDPIRSTSPDNFTDESIIGKPVLEDVPLQELVNSEEIIVGSEEIPDWMRSSGWESTEGLIPEKSEIEEQLPDVEDQLAKADIPDWLNEMAPLEENLEIGKPIEGSVIEFNKQIESASMENPLVPDEIGGVEDPLSTDGVRPEVPEWLQEMGMMESSQKEEPILLQAEDGEQEPSSNLNSEPIQEVLERQNEQPEFDTDFLKDIPPDIGNSDNELEETTNEIQPDWLKEPEPDFLRDREIVTGTSIVEENESQALSDESIISEGQENLLSESKPEEDLPDWLKEINLPSEVNPVTDEIPTVLTSEMESSSDAKLQSSVSEISTESDEGRVENLKPEALIIEPFLDEEPIESRPPSQDEQDAAFAWLEGLASRQGAKEEELLTPQDERLEEPPDWVRGIFDGKVTSVEDVESNQISEDSKPDESFPSKTIYPVGVENSEEMNKSGKSYEEEELGKEPEEEVPLPIIGEEDSKSQDQILGTVEVSPKEENETTREELFFGNSHLQEFVNGNEQNSLPSPDLETKSEKDVSDWLKEMEEKEGITNISSEEFKGGKVSGRDQSESLPGWLQEVDKEARASEWIPEIENSPEMEKDPGVSDLIPEQQVSNEAHEAIFAEPEGSISHLEEENELPLEPFIKPVTSDEWKPMEEVGLKVPPDSPLSSKIELMASGKLPGTGILSKIPGINVEKESATLEKAQAFIEKDDLKKALFEYGHLIKKGQMLEQVVHDLREITYRYPVEISIWQMLGDALMRANRIQDALDAYTKAEELLR
jgi:tetratricopeptide (TPR) repeat protein